jgi:hypothetical protein
MPASARKHAVAASRGAVLALHAAAGLAVSVCRDAERLLRASEGLARSAVACLERANRPQVASSEGVGAVRSGVAGASSTKQEKKKNSRRRSKKKGMDLDKVELDKVQGMVKTTSSAKPSGPVAPLSASAAVFVPVAGSSGLGVDSEEICDGWADDLPMIGPTMPRPAVGAARPRTLIPRRSSTRSPRRDDHLPSTSTSCPPPVALEPGRIAVIRDLDSRPELNGQKVRLIEMVVASGRWICALRSDERIRVLPEKLAGLHAGFQGLAEEQFLEQTVL